jgi:hypothetical protein
MSIVIRTAFNNQNWDGKCHDADRDRRLFQCKQEVVNTGYKIDKTGICKATCWESTLCSEYWWLCLSGNFSTDKASGRAYFIYRDIGGTLVLWGRSKITEVADNIVYFKKFKPLSDAKLRHDLTYGYLENIGVPSWHRGTFRYISENTADILDELIDEADNYFDDPVEPFSDVEDKKILRHHLVTERSSKLVKQFKASLDNLECSVCHFDFSTAYGTKLGEGFIEAHHTLQLSALAKGKRVSTDDLVAVCSNCHRMLHRKSPLITIKELKKAVRQNSK